MLVPVIIKGPWDDPAITPDLTGVIAQRALEDPEAFKEEVEQQIDQLGEAGKAIKKGDPQKMLEGLLGGQGGGGQGNNSARKLLKGLFGN